MDFFIIALEPIIACLLSTVYLWSTVLNYRIFVLDLVFRKGGGIVRIFMVLYTVTSFYHSTVSYLEPLIIKLLLTQALATSSSGTDTDFIQLQQWII